MRPLAAGQSYPLSDPVPFFFEFFLFSLESLGNGPGFLGEWVYNSPIFEACPYTWEGNFSFLMELEDLFFFQIFFFLKLEHPSTFISTVKILVS
jgi:hypothetical protein